MRIAVVGGSGRAGEYIIAECAAAGHELVNADQRPPGPDYRDSGATFLRTDAENLGEVVAATRGADAVIHMAAIASPTTEPEYSLFRTNMMSNWAVLEACEINGVERVVMASSINAIGAVFGDRLIPPEYLPVDEDHPTRMQDAYSQSKWLGEQMAAAFVRRGKIAQIASMRFHALWDPPTARAYREKGNKQNSSHQAMDFWSWVGRHDAARACRLGIERHLDGHEAFFINASDTVLEIPTAEAIAREYPGVEIRQPLDGFASILSNAKAGELLGWEPVESWRTGAVKEPEPAAEARHSGYEAPWRRGE